MKDGLEPPAPGRGVPGGRRHAATLRAETPGAKTLERCLTEALRFIEAVHGKIAAALDESIDHLTAQTSPGEDDLRLLNDFHMLQRDKLALGRAFQETFARQFHEDVGAADTPERGSSVTAGAGDSGFSLVDDQHLEEWIAIDRLVGKIGDRHGDEIQALTQRFRMLAPQTGAVCPLGPERFCHAFNGALGSLEVASKMRVRCFELLYRILVPDIGAFYASANKLLIGCGVLPDLRIGPVAQTPVRARPDRRSAARASGEQHPRAGIAAAESSWSDEVETAGSHGAGGTFRGAGPTPIQEQMFMAMQHLLRAHFRQDGGGMGTGAGVSGVALAGEGDDVTLPVTPMLIDTLSLLQRDDSLVDQAGELIRGGLRQQVVGRFAGGPEGTVAGINRIDDETIEVISMIFDYILDDRSLPDFMKALIGRLQIPVLKVAIIDREFFSRKSHPARQLLNELSHAGIGWREESEAAKDRLYQKMETVVRRILDEFESDIAIFDEVLGEFRAFLDEETRSFNAAKTQLLEAAQQNERREKLTLRIAETLAKRLIDRDLPAELREYLLTPWRERVVDVVFTEGGESGAARVAFGFLDDLLWSLEPKTESGDRKRLVQMLPALLETLRGGLQQAGYAGADSERIILALQERHFECMKAPRRVADTPSPAPDVPDEARPAGPDAGPARSTGSAGFDQAEARGAPETNDVDRMFDEITQDLDELSSLDWDHLASFDDVIDAKSAGDQRAFEQMIAEMGLEFDRDEGPRIDDEFTERVRQLEPGVWVELTGEDGNTRRGKLAWKGDDYSSYSFVNRQYKVVAERPLYVLADDFRQGRARVIEDVALFDRAVDGVISGIVRIAGSAGK